ncbi:MAG: thioredoxin-dependent thiol peroxidase [Patescibacteria group bacterium]
MSFPKIDSKAPSFSLTDQAGAPHTLADYAGKWVLIYFYPKDNTPGCTVEALAFESKLPDFTKYNCVILGVSIDSEAAHKKFCEKQNLTFTLLSDVDKKMVHAYGVWDKKKFMGREYMGILRTSFLVNPLGIIAKVYENVKPPVHANEVLNDLSALSK